MADKNYSVDDILNEIDPDKPSDDKGGAVFGVTEIIDSSKLKALHKEKANNMDDSPFFTVPLPADLEKEKLKKANEILEIAKRNKAAEKPDVQAEQAVSKTNTDITEEKRKKAEELLKMSEKQRVDILDTEQLPVFSSEEEARDAIRLRLEHEKKKKIAAINRALNKRSSKDEKVLKDEFIDQLNPLAATAEMPKEAKKDAETTKEVATGDTVAVAGNDLKSLAKKADEDVKEYKPENKQESPLFDIKSRSTKEKRSDNALIADLNTRIKHKKEEEPVKPETTPLPQPYSLNINYDKQVIADTSNMPVVDETSPILPTEDEISAVKERRKKRIRDFVLADLDSEEQPEIEEEHDVDTETDTDDAAVIYERLVTAKQGLKSRALLMGLLAAVSLAIIIINQVDPRFPISIINMRLDPKGFLYTFLVIGIFAFGICSSVISSGITKLFTLNADGDSIAAVSIFTSMIMIVVHLVNSDYIQRGIAHIYMTSALLALFFNTLGKLFMLKSALTNFNFITGDSRKYYLEILPEDDADIIAKGTVSELPVTAVMRKTEFLSDFLPSTYVYDKSDRISRFLAPAILVAGIIVGLIAYFYVVPGQNMDYRLYWAVSAGNFVVAAMSPLSIMLLISLLFMRSSKELSKSSAALLGYEAAEEFAEVNTVAIDAASLFPAGFVKFKSMKRCQREGSLQDVVIDEAIILATSLATSSGSVLSPMFYDMVGGKSHLLRKVSGVVCEDGLGVTGWVGSRRIMLGSREHMKSHQIELPDIKKEQKYSGGSDVIYLAVAGEAVAMFFISLIANPEVKNYLQEMDRRGMTVIVRTNDSLITVNKLAELFDLSPEAVRILPQTLDERFKELTKYTSRGSAAASCNGNFSGFARTILASKAIKENSSFATTVMLGGALLAFIVGIIFTMFYTYKAMDELFVVIFSLIVCAAVTGVQLIRKY